MPCNLGLSVSVFSFCSLFCCSLFLSCYSYLSLGLPWALSLSLSPLFLFLASIPSHITRPSHFSALASSARSGGWGFGHRLGCDGLGGVKEAKFKHQAFISLHISLSECFIVKFLIVVIIVRVIIIV
eukprot:m.279372 g.279372  ORF g.279372 m.279372 type:complete len:127 (-) comp100720_c0_seq1:545-925(-)